MFDGTFELHKSPTFLHRQRQRVNPQHHPDICNVYFFAGGAILTIYERSFFTAHTLWHRKSALTLLVRNVIQTIYCVCILYHFLQWDGTCCWNISQLSCTFHPKLSNDTRGQGINIVISKIPSFITRKVKYGGHSINCTRFICLLRNLRGQTWYTINANPI